MTDLVDTITTSISLCYYYFHSMKLGSGGVSTSSVGGFPSWWVSKLCPISAWSLSTSEGLPFSLIWSLFQINLEPILLSLALPVLASGSASPLCLLIDMIPEIGGSLVMGEDWVCIQKESRQEKKLRENPETWRRAWLEAFLFLLKILITKTYWVTSMYQSLYIAQGSVSLMDNLF